MKRHLCRLLVAAVATLLPFLIHVGVVEAGSVGRYANCSELRAAAHSFPGGSMLFAEVHRNGALANSWNYTPVEVYVPVAGCGYTWHVFVLGPNWAVYYNEWGSV